MSVTADVSVTADTLFHATKIHLIVWFWDIYLMVSEKGDISTLRSSKPLGVSWITAGTMLRKIKKLMAHLNSIRLANMIKWTTPLPEIRPPARALVMPRNNGLCLLRLRPVKKGRVCCHASYRQYIQKEYIAFLSGTLALVRLSRLSVPSVEHCQPTACASKANNTS